MEVTVAFEPTDATQQRYLTVLYGTGALCLASRFAVQLGAWRRSVAGPGDHRGSLPWSPDCISRTLIVAKLVESGILPTACRD